MIWQNFLLILERSRKCTLMLWVVSDWFTFPGIQGLLHPSVHECMHTLPYDIHTLPYHILPLRTKRFRFYPSLYMGCQVHKTISLIQKANNVKNNHESYNCTRFSRVRFTYFLTYHTRCSRFCGGSRFPHQWALIAIKDRTVPKGGQSSTELIHRYKFSYMYI